MTSFYDLLNQIRCRPTLYLSRYSIFEFQTFYQAYQFARQDADLPITAEALEFETFLDWIRERLNARTNHSWASLILFHYSLEGDERLALDQLFELWDEFQAQKQQQPLADRHSLSRAS